MLVLGRHLQSIPSEWPAWLRTVLAAWQRGGWIGVDLFFVLSGFLVSGLLFAEHRRTGHPSIGRFYLRRGLKIYPPFYAMLAVSVFVDWFRGRHIPAIPLLSELVFVQSYVGALWNHTWSLAVEEHFYVLLPLLLVLLTRLGRQMALPIIVLAVCVGTLIARLSHASDVPHYRHLTHLFATHLRLDSLAAGVFLAYVYHGHRERFLRVVTPRRWVFVLAGALLMAPAFVFPLETTPAIYTVGLTVWYLASALIVSALVTMQPPTWLSPIAFVGASSYSIYLWHMPVLVWGPSALAKVGISLGPAAQLACYIVGSILVGLVMARAIETPTLRLRDRLWPATAASIRRPSLRARTQLA